MWTLLLALACRDKDVIDTASPDLDGDGVPASQDCDDDRAEVWPGADELCDGLDNDCDGQVDESAGDLWYADRDGDGWGDEQTVTQGCAAGDETVAKPGDCDDLDATANPDAEEVCDEVDNDCDGSVDEEVLQSWYEDADQDGHGAGDGVEACRAPTGHVAVDTDCDDDDPTVNPDGVELCNGGDDDCDGDVDEGAADAEDWWTDADGDGYGDPEGHVDACTQPSGAVGNDDDCDDSDAALNPDTLWYQDADGDGQGSSYTIASCEQPSGAVDNDEDCDDTDASSFVGGQEACDGADNDCDNLVDEGVTSTWYLDADGDGYGLSTVTTEDCSAPTGFAGVDGDCDDGDATVNPGVTSDGCDEVDEDCDGDVDEDAPAGQSSACPAQDCAEVLADDGAATDGLYYLDPDGTLIDGWCDMSTDGGGWTLVGYEPSGTEGTFQYLGSETGSASALANQTGAGLLGVRYAGLYTEVRIDWGSDSIQFTPAAEVFDDSVDTSIAVSAFSTTDSTLAGWVTGAGGAHFCRAAASGTQPGDSSWAVKDLNDTYTGCGCNSGSWTGQGAYYGGSRTPTVCGAHGGGWAGVKSSGQPKGGITSNTTTLWVR